MKLYEIIFEADTRADKFFDVIMIIGFGIIALPTGIVTAELTQVYKLRFQI
jgi:hypothetical protein